MCSLQSCLARLLPNVPRVLSYEPQLLARQVRYARFQSAYVVSLCSYYAAAKDALFSTISDPDVSASRQVLMLVFNSYICVAPSIPVRMIPHEVSVIRLTHVSYVVLQ